MLRLDQRYFRTLNFLFFGTFLLLAIGGYFYLRRVEISNHRTMLHNLIIQYQLIHPTDTQRSFYLKSLHDQTGVRVTLIDSNGTVIYESNRDPKGMENHFGRPELSMARSNRWGHAVRHSVTLGRDMLYVASKTAQGYIRMAYPLSTIQEKFLPLWLKVVTLFGLALGSALWLTIRINRSISQDVQRINTSLEHLLAKRYDDTAIHVQCCQELDTISRQIAKVAARLKKRDRQKNKYTKKLKRLTEQQSEIISAISHEFKNPVAAIIGYAQTIYDDPDLSPELREKFLEKVIRNSERISQMIDRLSMAIKFENNALEPKKETFDLSTLTEEIVENLQQKYPDRTIKLSLKSTPIIADRMMFAQVITNLIDNALKYSEEPIAVTLENNKFNVVDHGIGIAAEDMEKVTQRFFRADTQSWDNSIGVGLYIVQYILQLHDTKIDIESTPGVGSTFGFDITSEINDYNM